MKQETYIEKTDGIWRMKINANTYYELGYKQGELLKTIKHPLFKLIKKKYVQVLISLLYAAKRKGFKKLRIQKKYRDELRGLSHATEIPYKVLLWINFAFDLYKRNVMCSSFGFFNQRETVIGRNTDINKPLAKLILKYEGTIVTTVRMNEIEYSHISFPLVIGVLNGYNKHGITTNPHLLRGVANGKVSIEASPVILQLKEIMEEARDLEDTKKILHKYNPSRAVLLLITSTKEKKSYICEAHPQKSTYTYNITNYQACTMHYQEHEMRHFQRGSMMATQKRLAYLNRALERTNEMTIGRAKEILRNTQEGTRRTTSGGSSLTNRGTFQSFLMLPEQNIIYYSNGQRVPVSLTGEYKEIKL